jgi:hypothetical protein
MGLKAGKRGARVPNTLDFTHEESKITMIHANLVAANRCINADAQPSVSAQKVCLMNAIYA